MHCRGQNMLSHSFARLTTTAKTSASRPPSCQRCLLLRSYVVNLPCSSWTQPSRYLTTSLRPKPKGASKITSVNTNPSATSVEVAPIPGHDSTPPIAPRGRLQKVKRLPIPSELTSPTASKISTMMGHLTNVYPGDYDNVLQGHAGEKRLYNFSRLHAALQNPHYPESIWNTYLEIRKVRKDVNMLSSDLRRLLTIHFKEASKPSTNNGSSYRNQVPLYETWNARIITVLNDKRSANMEFTRWDSSDLMSALNRLGRYEESLQEFDQVLASRKKVDPILLNHAVRAWGGLGKLGKAVEAVREMRTRYDARASEYTLGYLIQQHLLVGQRPQAIALWHEMLEAGTMDDIGTVNGILRACVKVRESSFAQAIYDALPGLGAETNLESLNLMLSLAVAEIQYPEERSQFLRAIHDKIAASDKLVFDKGMLDSILVNFAKKGDAEGAILVHRLMTNYGLPPGTEEHNHILHCYARLEQMDKAIDWLQQMRRSGIRPNRVSYVLLMRSYTRQRMPRETEALFRQLILDGIRPDLTICNHLLLAYEQARMNRRCLQLYKTMLQDRSIGVDQFSFSCMFNAIFHSDKAILEGGEGLGGQGSTLDDARFLERISEPIGQSFIQSEQTNLTLENEGSQVIDTSELPAPSDTSLAQQRYQFDDATSTTDTLSPRALFRDMVIIGIRPSRSLYSNVLRAFLAQNDYAGAAVALRALVDHYVLKPTPKMNAIVVTWVYQELDRRGVSNKENALTKGELSKLVNMMGRARGLIEMLEKIVNVEGWGQDDACEGVASPQTSTSPAESTITALKHRSRTNKGFGDERIDDPMARATMEMGGDLVDLHSKGVLAGSTWGPVEDSPIQIDLKDFERWFRGYSLRTTYAQAIKSKPSSSQLTRPSAK